MAAEVYVFVVSIFLVILTAPEAAIEKDLSMAVTNCLVMAAVPVAAYTRVFKMPFVRVDAPVAALTRVLPILLTTLDVPVAAYESNRTAVMTVDVTAVPVAVCTSCRAVRMALEKADVPVAAKDRALPMFLVMAAVAIAE